MAAAVPSDPLAKNRDSKGASPPLELDVDITDFGPISRGKFKIKPLTILVGPNNSGKTYAAMLLHSMFSAHEKAARCWLVPELVAGMISTPWFVDLAAKMGEFLGKVPHAGGQIAIPGSYVNDVKTCVLRQTAEENFPQNLTENFGLRLQDMVRIGTTRATLKISSKDQIAASVAKRVTSKYAFSDQDFILELGADKQLSLWPAHIVKNQHDSARTHLDKTIGKHTRRLVAEIPFNLGRETAALLSLISYIVRVPAIYFPNRSFYFPAARSGVMRAYKPMLSSAISSHKHSRRLHEPPDTTGIVSDFLRSLIGVAHDGNTPISKIGDSLEATMFGGTILIQEDAPGATEIHYKFMGKDLPIHTSSSSVAENAPLSIFLRHKVHPHDMLIIEEPEEHLHPASQLTLARHVVHLVRSGVRVFLATHSLFFLESLSMFVKLGNLTEKQRRNRNYGRNDYLLDSEVAPYAFKKKSPGNYVMQEIPHSAKEGISQEEFVNVEMSMYNEGVLLDDIIASNNGGAA